MVPEAEANTRIAKGLAAIAKGVASIRGHKEVAEDDIQDAFRVGLDSLQDYCRRLFLAIAGAKDPASVGIPRTMRERELEELTELGVVEETASGHKLSGRVQELWTRASVKLNS